MSESNQKEVSEIKALVYSDFNVDQDSTDLRAADMDEFRKKLELVIGYLLDKDFERLLTAMYRLDINEKKFSQVLEGKMGMNIAGAIANLVIERELKKIETRKKYRT